MAFIFVLFYITCIYMRPGEWIPAFYGWQLMDITAIAAIIFLALGLLNSKKGLVKAPQNILILGFLGAVVLSHLSHFYIWGAKNAFIDFFRKVILYFLVVNIINTEKRFKIIINAIIFFTLVMAIQGIIQYNTGIGLAGQFMSRQGRINWIGIFSDANDLALSFVIIIPFLLGFLFNSSSSFRVKIITIPVLGTFLYAMYLTNSRGGVLALMVVIFLFFIFKFKKRRHKIIGGIIGGFLAFLIFIFGPSRMSMITTAEGSAFGRVEAWHEGFQMLKSNPFFGVGKGMFMKDYRLVAHNSFIHCAAETGFIGLFFWIALFYLCLKNLKTLQMKEVKSTEAKNLKLYSYSLSLGLVGFLAAAFFLSRTYIVIPYLLIALIVALFNITQNRLGSLENVFCFRDVRNVGFLCIGILGLIITVVKITL